MLRPFAGLTTGGRGEFCPVNLGESLKIQVVWYVMLCHWMNSSQCFEGSQVLHPQGQAVQED
jgi:hypothetical protein